jgi:hypothetical protein
MNDGTIGSATSGATTRANIDTFPLYDLIWQTFQANQTLAPTVPPNYGVSSVADFTANKPITLTVQAGRLIAGVSGSHLIGTSGGDDTHVNLLTELAEHHHAPGAGTGNPTLFAGLGGSGGITTQTAAIGAGSFSVTADTGSSTAWDIRQPTVYQNIFIKL